MTIQLEKFTILKLSEAYSAIDFDIPLTHDDSSIDPKEKLTSSVYRISRRIFNEINAQYHPSVDMNKYLRNAETKWTSENNPFYLRHHLSKRTERCNDCKALMFIEESIAGLNLFIRPSKSIEYQSEHVSHM